MPKIALAPKGAIAAGALFTYLRPRLAQDAQIDLKACLAPMRGGKSFGDVKPKIANAVRSVVKGKLAQDADIDDVAALLDAIEQVVDEPAASVPEGLGEENGEIEIADVDDDGDPEVVRDDDQPELLAKIREFIKDRVDDETLAQFDQLVGGGVAPVEAPEPEEVIEEPDEDDDMNRDGKMAGDNDPKIKPAMDAAIRRERENQRAIFRAVNHVKQTTGELANMREMAYDSAEEVFADGLKYLGVKADGIHPSAFAAVFDAHAAARQTRHQQRPGRSGSPRIAADGLPDGVKKFGERFPNAARIQRM